MRRLAVVFVLGAVLRAMVLGAAEPARIIEESGITRGLVVHVGLGNDSLAMDFARRGGFLICGLTTDPGALRDMRASILKEGAAEHTHVQLVTGYRRLPFADHLVNLLIVDLDALAGEAPSLDEIERVLAPRPLGAAWIKRDGKWRSHSKPRTAAMGEWRHHRMDPNGNMATDDRGPVPSGVQWLAGPFFVRCGRKSSTQALVTADGRNIYLTQNEHDVPEDPYFLIARDGYNGLPIWQRPWNGPNRGGSGETSFAVVATPEFIFGVDDGRPVAVDARTGELVRTYSSTGTRQIAVLGDTLVAHTDTGVSVFAIDRETPRWQTHLAPGNQKKNKKLRWRAPRSILAFGASRIYLLDNPGQQLHCLDLEHGKEHWRVMLADSATYRTVNFADDRVIGIAQTKKLEVYSGKDGTLLWSREGDYTPRFGNLQQNGHYLTGEGVWVRTRRYDWEIVSPQNGERIRMFETGMGGKNGCQGAILSGSHLVASRASTFFEIKSGEKRSFTFSRGGCGVGFIPANGLHYTIPHACACFSKAIRGSMGLRGGHVIPDPAYRTDLVSGQASRKIAAGQDAPWSTFCASAARNSFSGTELPNRMRLIWKKQLARVDGRFVASEWALRTGAPVTQAVMDRERVYVGLVNTHQLVALDAASGETRWSYTAEGRVSAPPTIHKGLCLFGDHAGFVHCVHADDGTLRWRLRAARNEELIVAYGQLESPWPVQGGVLVDKGVAVFLSGRADGADGGVTAFGVDPLTGEEIWRRPVAAKVGTAGVLTRGDRGVCAMGVVLNPADGQEPTDGKGVLGAVRPNIAGLQDASWTRLVLARRKNISTRFFTGGKLEIRGHLVAVGNQGDTTLAVYTGGDGSVAANGAFKWNRTCEDLGFQPESLVMVKGKVVASGTEGGAGRAAVLSARDGSELWTCDLPAPPIHQGLAAGNGRLYVSCADGPLHCYGNTATRGEPHASAQKRLGSTDCRCSPLATCPLCARVFSSHRRGAASPL